jgi:hypothetical protein
MVAEDDTDDEDEGDEDCWLIRFSPNSLNNDSDSKLF